jgi:hypothetical protein
MYADAASFIGPWVAAFCSATVGSYFSEYLVSIFTGASMLVLASIPGALRPPTQRNIHACTVYARLSAAHAAAETLMDDRPNGSEPWVIKKDRKPAHRKPFSLGTANPFANILLLFRNGPGLRALATTTAIQFSVNEIWSTQGTYR